MAVPGIVYTTEVMWSAGTWTNLTTDPQSYDIARGRTDDLGTMQMGKATIRLFDKTGKYSATSTTSPYAGLIRPMKPVRVRATSADGTFGLFYGFLSRCETNPDYGTQQATLEANDLFTWLDRAKPTIGTVYNTTTGTAIGLLLDSIGWTDPAMRSLAIGDSIPAFGADGSLSALSLIGDLLQTERGLFYIRGDGVAVYDARHARFQGARAASQATIPGTMQAVAPGTDIATIANRATVTAGAGVPQTYYDAASGAEFGPSDFGAITSAYLATDVQAASLAQYMVRQRKDPTPTARRLALLSDLSSVRLPMLQRDLSDRVTVTSAISGLTGDYHIESINHTVSVEMMRHICIWTLSKHPAVEPFRVGISAVGGPDVISY